MADEQKEITLNGKKYVLKEEEKKNNDILIMDPANVMALIKSPEDDADNEGVVKLTTPDCDFKRLGMLQDNCWLRGDNEVYIIGEKETKVSADYVMIIKKTVNAFYKKRTASQSIEVWVGWDKDSKEYKKDYPVLFTYSDLGFILAPRVDSD